MSADYPEWPPSDPSFRKLSEVKKRLLEVLWSMEWVESSALYQVTGQTYYDRRLRELRESGWQIESRGPRFRLASREKLQGNIRQYPSAKQKREVKERDKNTCQICAALDAHIQFDHKVPLERQGPTEVNNLQLLCRACNVEKRGVCKRCTLTTCDGCPYAYPELYGGRFAIFLDKTTAEKLRAEAQQRGDQEAIITAEIISLYYSRK
jgi:hypothetical protein